MPTKTFRPLPDRRQRLLLPPSLDECLPEDQLAYFVLDVVEQLDLSPIYAYYERELRGFPPHEPKMMAALLLYGYSVGVPSSRKIERRTHEDVAFRLIACGQHPDHSCICEFRRIHRAVLTGLFAQGLVLCQKAALVKLGHVALDGTKVKANASKHKAMSYDRMKEREAELAQKVDELMRVAEEADAAEDARYGKNRRGDELPEDLRRAESRLAKIRAAKAELEAEAKQQKEAEKKKDDRPSPSGPTPLPSHQIPSDSEGTPTPKAQRNFTDAESRIQKSSDGFVQGYNGPRADLSTKERMARKLATKNGAAVYARRKAVVEPVFGQIKHARGFRQFLMRGMEMVRVEWSLLCMTHNLLKLYRATMAA